ncbi:MAG: disulfide bond formation protein DsbA [Leptothrix sp. (in: Bacteria)]|nr:disulfide bond formation protein DsbA [Leptothrix sp. (in: b-proteobacteria)]
MNTTPLKIDFVSDVACPWCAVGLHALERAVEKLGPGIAVEMRFQPFEINPTMAPEGADAAAYLKAKYGLNDAQLAHNRSHIRERGAAVGFAFGERVHVWNTFDAHRLLHWAALPGPHHVPGAQRALKHALLQAYHGDGRNPGATDVLLDLAAQVGLDVAAAREVLASDRYALEVRAAEQAWQRAGIHSVPAIVINERHLISGGQPPEVFEQALRQIAAEPVADGSAAGSTA